MNVLVVTNMWPTVDEPSFGCFVAEQVEDLRSLGLHVDVIAFDGRRDRRNYVRAAKAVRHAVRHQPVSIVHAHYGLTGAVAATQRSVPVQKTKGVPHAASLSAMRQVLLPFKFISSRTASKFCSSIRASA